MTPTRDERLAKYREKRTASRTPEPFGGRGWQHLRHAKARRRSLHWDLRLELDGVLLSWALPKGPSPNQADKRLAMKTEDHPLEYAEFEGVIPQGEYGGGAVIVWDRGVWVLLEDAREGLEKGKLLFELRGHKLFGKGMDLRAEVRRVSPAGRALASGTLSALASGTRHDPHVSRDRARCPQPPL